MHYFAETGLLNNEEEDEMKRFFCVILSVCFIYLCTACTVDSIFRHDAITSMVPTTETTYFISQSRDAAHFESESAMIEQLKAGTVVNDAFETEKLDYYFRLKMLPEGWKLVDIRLKSFYLAFDYVTDDKEPNLSTNMITFVWYRTLFGEGLMESSIHAGIPWEPMSKNDAYSFFTSEAFGLDESGLIDQSLPKVAVNKLIQWTQDEGCFQVNAPLWFTEDDALKYCIAEKVLIE